jgi:hypothetical protein
LVEGPTIMATADVAAPARAEWAPGNPWAWAWTGLALSGLALLWVRVLGEEWTGVRLLLILLSLLAAGGAVTIRLCCSGGAFLNGLSPGKRSAALLALAGAGIALSGAATGLLLAFLWDQDIPWELPGILRVWILAFPAGVAMVLYFFHRHATGKAVSASAESATLLIFAAVTTFLGCWALYVNQEVVWEDQVEFTGRDWDTARLFLAVLAAVAFLAAPLVLLPTRWRRRTVSGLIVVHFGAILMATLSPAPSPWLVSEIIGRVYRPYMEFMYLGNAYHFYAPDPGPSSYLWSYVRYTDKEGKQWADWYKMPNLDEDGRPTYATALSYQRRVALMENARGNDAAPPFFVLSAQGHPIVNPRYYWRAVNSPNPPDPVVGRPNPRPRLIVPFHPEGSWWTQYLPPNSFNQKMISSYASHIATAWELNHPGTSVDSVMVYWAVHTIVNRGPLVAGRDPAHPAMYLPYYQGKFDREGKLLDEPIYTNIGGMLNPDTGDPFMYWLIPILIDGPQENDSPVYDYVRLHAGDPNWHRPQGSKEWRPARNPVAK